MVKKACLITGATSGLGKYLSTRLSEEDYELILVSKSKSKLRNLSKKLSKRNNKFFAIDLSNLKEVKKFAKKINNIDILINNAGGFYFKERKNKFKINKTIVLNYYTPYFLIHNLILNKKFKKKLVINISSRALLNSKIHISKINNLNEYNGWEIYKFSKFLMFEMSNYLSKLYNNVQFITFDPGRMSTNFGSTNSFFLRNLTKVYLLIFGKKPSLVANEVINFIKKNKKKSKFISNNRVFKTYGSNFQKNLFLYTNKLLKINKKL